MSKVVAPFNNLDDKATEEIKKRINGMKVGNMIVSNKSPNIPKFVDEILVVDYSGAMHSTIACVEKRIK